MIAVWVLYAVTVALVAAVLADAQPGVLLVAGAMFALTAAVSLLVRSALRDLTP